MKNNKTVRNIIKIIASNCTTIISGIIVSFLVPKILSLEGYGFYKIFTLYMVYSGFLSLGIIDGIVLKHGGENYEDLNKLLFRCYFKWYLIVHFLWGIILVLVGAFLKDSNYKFIFIMLGINVFAVNFAGYFQQISQITQRFKEYSFRKVLQSILNILIVIVLFLVHINNFQVTYQHYVIALVDSNLILMLWYIHTYREISLGDSFSLKETKNEIICLMKIGFPLLFANILSTLILNIDRQFVSSLFDTTTYAIYAFAYNMLSLVTVATSAISIVIYPTLKRTTHENIKENYSKFISIILVFVFGMITLYYPLCYIIICFLPQYVDSLIIFRIVFPGLSISSAITVIMHNYYKILGRSFDYFKKSVEVLIISIIANIIAYSFFKTTVAISIASILIMIFWYISIEQYIVRLYQCDRKKNFIYLILMLNVFYLVTNIESSLLGFFVYIVLFVFISYIFFKSSLFSNLNIVKNRK